MNGNSKREKIGDFMRARVRDAVYAVEFERPGVTLLDALKALEIQLSSSVAYDAYRLRQLVDICTWKKPPTSE